MDSFPKYSDANFHLPSFMEERRFICLRSPQFPFDSVCELLISVLEVQMPFNPVTANSVCVRREIEYSMNEHSIQHHHLDWNLTPETEALTVLLRLRDGDTLFYSNSHITQHAHVYILPVPVSHTNRTPSRENL